MDVRVLDALHALRDIAELHVVIEHSASLSISELVVAGELRKRVVGEADGIAQGKAFVRIVDAAQAVVDPHEVAVG